MNNITECFHCGLFIKKKKKFLKKHKLKCPRCSSKIKLKSSHSLDSLYYAICALLLFILLNIYPLISLSLNGVELKATLYNTFFDFDKTGLYFCCYSCILYYYFSSYFKLFCNHFCIYSKLYEKKTFFKKSTL